MSCLCPSFFSCSLEKTEKERRRFYLENGGLLLKELIASSDGKYNPFRIYSEAELKKATNNYDPSCVFSCNNIGGKWYKGTIEGRAVSICKIGWFSYKNQSKDFRAANQRSACKMAVTDVSISAMLSGQKNVLKLLGCCLEKRVPTMVYEYIGNGTLYDRIHTTTRTDSQPLSWKSWLEIARELAHAIAYLHAAFTRPIIHREINPSNILLDQNYVVKLSNFSSSMIIDEGETVSVDSCGGTIGYFSADVGYLVNERIDIRNFGALLLELLTGKEPYELHNLATEKHSSISCDEVHTCVRGHIKDYLSCLSIEDIVDPKFFLPQGGGSEQQQLLHQWKAVKELALKCVAIPLDDPTTMVEVTKQLKQIQLS